MKWTFFNKIINIILNITFPQSKTERRLETITAEEFFNSAVKTKHTNKNIITIFSYNDPLVKKAIWSLKFRKKKRLAKIFAQILYDRLLEELVDLERLKNFKNPLLIAIPISKKRFRERGFNQCDLIARELCRLNDNQSFRWEKGNLVKIKDTPHQSRAKSKKERRENLKNCFAIKNPQKILGRNIILLDDITTTGTTLNEAQKILKENRAKKIIYLTIAH